MNLLAEQANRRKSTVSTHGRKLSTVTVGTREISAVSMSAQPRKASSVYGDRRKSIIDVIEESSKPIDLFDRCKVKK